MGASNGEPSGGAQPSVTPHLRFLEASGYERSEFENDRIEQAAEALEERADGAGSEDRNRHGCPAWSTRLSCTRAACTLIRPAAVVMVRGSARPLRTTTRRPVAP